MNRLCWFSSVVLCNVVLSIWTCTAKAQEPIRVGFVFLMSGRMAAFGVVAKQGAQVALKEINDSGGVMGRQLVGIFRDSKGERSAAREVFKELVEKQRVQVLMGVLTDDVALELSGLAGVRKVPLLITGAQTHAVTGRSCNRYTFRLCPSSRHNAKVGARLAGWTNSFNWTIVASDHPSNRELWEHFRRYLREAGTGATFSKPQETVFVQHESANWKRVASQITNSTADGVLICLDSGDFIDFVEEGNALGLFRSKREFVSVNGSLAELLALGSSMPQGIWWSCTHRTRSIRSAEYASVSKCRASQWWFRWKPG